VQIENARGELIRKLAASQPTRPQALTPEGSLFYWNGLDDQGMPVPGGIYHIVASTRLDGERYEAREEVVVKEPGT
jgi:flagellar hook assembly protein FlgD